MSWQLYKSILRFKKEQQQQTKKTQETMTKKVTFKNKQN